MGASLLAVVTGGAAVVLVFSQFTNFVDSRIYADSEASKIFILGGGLLVWSVLLFFAVRAKTVRVAVTLFSIAPVLLMFGTHFMFPVEFEGKKMPGRFLESHSDRIDSETIIVSEAELAVAACYYYKRTDVYLYKGRGELAWGLDYEDAAGRLLSTDALKNLFDTHHGTRRLVLIVRRGHYEEYREMLPDPVFEDTFGRFTFVEF